MEGLLFTLGSTNHYKVSSIFIFILPKFKEAHTSPLKKEHENELKE